MLGIVGRFHLLIGTLFGVIMVVTKKEGILENVILYFLIGKVIDFFRAIPFIVLIFLIAPMTRAIVGTTIGLKGAMLPLAVGAIPFVARQIESALSEVDNGLIEASQAMGCLSAGNHLPRISEGKCTGHYPRNDDYADYADWLYCHGRRCRWRWSG